MEDPYYWSGQSRLQFLPLLDFHMGIFYFSNIGQGRRKFENLWVDKYIVRPFEVEGFASISVKIWGDNFPSAPASDIPDWKELRASTTCS